MAGAYGTQPTAAYVLRWIARAILIAWAIVWLYFYAGLIAEAYPQTGLNGALIPLLVLLAIVGVLALCWLLELLGALALLTAAVLAWYQWQQPHWFSLITICLPMLAASLLLIIAWAIARFGGQAARIPDLSLSDEQENKDEGRWEDPGW